MSTVRTPARRRMRRDDRARQLLEVAEAVISERGFQSASMDEIADRAGVTKPVLYDHFGSKDGLLAAVVRRAGGELRAAVVAAVAGAPGPEEALARGLRSYFEFVRSHAPAWHVLVSEAAAAGSAAGAMEEVRTEMAAFAAGVIVDELPGHDAAEAEIAAQALIGAAERLAVQSAAGRLRDDAPGRLVAGLMDVVWVGFADLRRGRRWVAGEFSEGPT